MTKKGKLNPNPPKTTLRERAFEKLRTAQIGISEMTTQNVKCLAQELEIHRIELEMQNEELRHSLAELSESRDRYSDLYDFAPVGYVTLDKNGRLLDINLTAATMLGMDRRILLRTNIAKFIAPESQDDWYLYRQAAFSSDRKQTCEIQMRRADRSLLAVRLEGVRFKSADEGCLTAIIDITEQKRAEEERKQLLARERAARQEAERASQSKDRFLAMISHELRTPLTSILGWSSLLKKNLKDFDRDRALESIERNATLQAKLIEDLLDISAMIAGKIRLDIQPVELASIVNDVINAVHPETKAKGIQTQTHVDEGACLCSGDPKRLQQVIRNLLANAVKFTPDGGRIVVRLQPEESDIRITVSDTGRGIPADFLPYIFDPFRQADTTSVRKHGGLGLGLAIVRQIVEMHGGTAHAASAGEGKGATFTILLPIKGPYGEEHVSINERRMRQMNAGCDAKGLRAECRF